MVGRARIDELRALRRPASSVPVTRFVDGHYHGQPTLHTALPRGLAMAPPSRRHPTPWRGREGWGLPITHSPIPRNRSSRRSPSMGTVASCCARDDRPRGRQAGKRAAELASPHLGRAVRRGAPSYIGSVGCRRLIRGGPEGTFHLRPPTSAHWALPDVSRTCPTWVFLHGCQLNVVIDVSRLWHYLPRLESVFGNLR